MYFYIIVESYSLVWVYKIIVCICEIIMYLWVCSIGKNEVWLRLL